MAPGVLEAWEGDRGGYGEMGSGERAGGGVPRPLALELGPRPCLTWGRPHLSFCPA